MGIGAYIKNRLLKQKAVYWGSPVSDGYGGHTWGSPVEIDCRWEDVTKVVQTRDGEEVVSVAQVFVDRDVVKGGVLWLGRLADLTSSQQSDPATVSGAYVIKRVEKLPEIDGNGFLRKVLL